MARVRRYRKCRGEWDDTTTWNVGDYVLHSTGVYRCLTQNTNDEPPSANWEEFAETPWPNKWANVEADWQIYRLQYAVSALQLWVANTFVVAMYSSMYGGGDAIIDLDATWQPITAYDGDAFTPKGITTDPVNGTIAFDVDGVYTLTIFINALHNEVNSSRNTGIRLFNVTDGVPGGQIVIGTARNQDVTALGVTLIVEIADADKGKLFRLEMGGFDDYTVIALSVSWDAASSGEWREPLTPIFPV